MTTEQQRNANEEVAAARRVANTKRPQSGDARAGAPRFGDGTLPSGHGGYGPACRSPIRASKAWVSSDGRISSLPWRRERGPHPWLMAAETPKVRVALADLLQPRVVHLGRSPLLRFGPSPPKHRAGGRQ